MSRRPPQTANLDRLISADPIERLLASMEDDIGRRTRRFTNPHVSLELEMLRSFKAELEEALRDARAADVVGNVKDAAELSKRPLSTVRRICSKHRERAGATMVEGEYSVHLPTFMRFIATLPGRAAGPGGDAGGLNLAATDTEPTDIHEPDSALEEAA